MGLSKAKWRKSIRSGNNGGACVEVANLHGVVAVRDSKNPEGPAMVFSPGAWHDFAAGLKRL
jgi:hypothetical protein